jgi:16S rRNA (cytosine1402-N4)-methyltransferase
MNGAMLHQPVLLGESLSLLGIGPGSRVVDGTVGLGGHAEAILERTAPDGRLLGLDRDEAALGEARRRLASFGERVELVHASFRDLGQVLAERGMAVVDAVLLDLGVSSPQLDRPERGFRFASETAAATPLDMRMDRSTGPTAAELLERTSEETLAGWFGRYGELPGSRRLAREIVRTRETTSLRSAADLLAAIERAGVGRGRRHHPATLVFQALRIAVNDELAALAEGLSQAVAHLRPGGRLVVIAYHSLEDRLVKQRFRELERGCVCPPRSPVCTCRRRPTLRRVTRRAVRPSEAEVRDNPRARSARLRAAERLPQEAA